MRVTLRQNETQTMKKCILNTLNPKRCRCNNFNNLTTNSLFEAAADEHAVCRTGITIIIS